MENLIHVSPTPTQTSLISTFTRLSTYLMCISCLYQLSGVQILLWLSCALMRSVCMIDTSLSLLCFYIFTSVLSILNSKNPLSKHITLWLNMDERRFFLLDLQVHHPLQFFKYESSLCTCMQITPLPFMVGSGGLMFMRNCHLHIIHCVNTYHNG